MTASNGVILSFYMPAVLTAMCVEEGVESRKPSNATKTNINFKVNVQVNCLSLFTLTTVVFILNTEFASRLTLQMNNFAFLTSDTIN